MTLHSRKLWQWCSSPIAAPHNSGKSYARRHGVGVTWQFIRKEVQGWDRSKRCEEQSNEKAYAVQRNPTRNAQKTQKRSQARTQRPGGAPGKRKLADAFFQGKCRRCGSTMHSVKDCKVSAEIICRNCNKAGHLAKICASHIFSPLSAEQQKRRQMVANLVEQGESSDEDAQEASPVSVSYTHLTLPTICSV